nr:AMP-binding protein [Rhodococcus sp. P1Y]
MRCSPLHHVTIITTHPSSAPAPTSPSAPPSADAPKTDCTSSSATSSTLPPTPPPTTSTTTTTTILDAFAHQHAPFEHITRTTNTPRTTNRTPLFQILLTHNTIDSDTEPTPDLPGIDVTNNGPSALGAVKTDLDLDIVDTPNGMTGYLTYATELFTPATIDRFTTTFERVLKTLTTAPETRLAALDALPAADSDQISALSTGPIVSVASSTLDALIRRQASVDPDALAVIDDRGSEWTYTGFDARINALAHVLVEHGVQVGDRVAVQLPRRVDLVTALFAVIRAGAAYVPIDPAYPDERIGHILDDATPAVVITRELLDDPTVAARLTQGESAAPVLARALTPADTAYVIFTSGTTGRPKGVTISHRAIVNRLSWMATDYRIGAGDRILQKTPSVFDVSVWEFFLPAVVGATLVVAKDGGHKDPSYLADIIDRHRITVLHFVPAMLAAFLTSAPDPHRLTSVRRVFFSGEALPPRTPPPQTTSSPAPNCTTSTAPPKPPSTSPPNRSTRTRSTPW